MAASLALFGLSQATLKHAMCPTHENTHKIQLHPHQKISKVFILVNLFPI